MTSAPERTRHYHQSSAELEAGTILSPSRCNDHGDAARALDPRRRCEGDVLELHRPLDAPPRSACVYLVDDAQAFERVGVEGPVWLVEPLGRQRRCDAGWLTELQILLERGVSEDALSRAARAYWAGQPCPVAVWTGYEILADAARVLEGPFDREALLDAAGVEIGSSRPTARRSAA